MVMGNTYELPDGGSVWLANEPVDLANGKKANGIVFVNSEGEKTQLALSDDALWALRMLHDARENPTSAGEWVAVEQFDGGIISLRKSTFYTHATAGTRNAYRKIVIAEAEQALTSTESEA